MQWEYLVETLPAHQATNIGIVKSIPLRERVIDYLNICGSQGWELVQISPAVGQVACDIYAAGTVFIFKRPKP